eukprot:TRINITY_DN1382_c0_g1_i2.p1 TRINITY_DN1382_c0_g1~~TRINITY_DN1382_c0_g1_i2.p1  ORF type:complete len:164 (-),score=30.63 TRINITY_DN1382_c0_g1_i2:75-566(-)
MAAPNALAVIEGLGLQGTFGCGVRDVPAAAFVHAYADYLKTNGKLEIPKWVDFVKTGRFKELSPLNPDWLYVRTAAIARHIYLKKGTGVGGFSKIYGGRHRNGVRRRHFKTASRGIIKYSLKQLQKLGVVDKDPKGRRFITSGGQQDLDRIAAQVKQKLTLKA